MRDGAGVLHLGARRPQRARPRTRRPVLRLAASPNASAQNSALPKRAFVTSRRSPPVRRKTSASRVDERRPAGRRRRSAAPSLREMNRAVAGCAARWSSSRWTSPSPPPAGDREAEHLLRAVVVVAPARYSVVAARSPRLSMPWPVRQREASIDVGLRVAGVDADRVQLEQLAAVVLVDPADHAAAHRARHRVQVVVEVVEHRRVQRGGAQQVAEAAEHVRAGSRRARRTRSSSGRSRR